MDTFLLNTQGQCLDPNCATINLATGQCQICLENYVKNAMDICKYKDPNCIEQK